jgi:DNA-binding transcriptional LysR family regulator
MNSSAYTKLMSIDTGDWERQRAFLAVLREGSLSGRGAGAGRGAADGAAADRELEAELGAPLFTRSPERLAADRASAGAGRPCRSDGAGRRRIRPLGLGSSARWPGTVRITASEVIAIEVLPARSSPLLARHPAW